MHPSCQSSGSSQERDIEVRKAKSHRLEDQHRRRADITDGSERESTSYQPDLEGTKVNCVYSSFLSVCARLAVEERIVIPSAKELIKVTVNVNGVAHEPELTALLLPLCYLL